MTQREDSEMYSSHREKAGKTIIQNKVLPKAKNKRNGVNLMLHIKGSPMGHSTGGELVLPVLGIAKSP